MMRILLASNSPYYPSLGGGNKSNRLLMEALAARGHSVRVITRTPQFGPGAHEQLAGELASRGVRHSSAGGPDIQLDVNGVHVRILSRDPSLRAYFARQISAFNPDIILTSTDDPAHLLLETAMRAARARVVYLVRATVALPFGPDGALRSATKTKVLRQTDGAVAVSEYVAEYARRWGGLNAIHLPISLLDPGPYPYLGRLENRFVTMVNPCAVKDISIFLGLAARLTGVEFAAVPTWGTTKADIARLRGMSNVTVLPPVDDIDDVMRQTRIMLVPSLWAEARSRVILEAMSRGIPVLASDVGGLAEAKLGVDYLLPVRPAVRFRPMVDELMVPVAEIPKQDVGPWQTVLERLLGDPVHYRQLSAESRRVAVTYASSLDVSKFEAYLEKILGSPARRVQPSAVAMETAACLPPKETLSAEKQKLLALRLRRKTGSAARDKRPPE